MRSEYNDDAYTFYLEGHIDSTNAAKMEDEIMKVKPIFENMDIAFDAEDLEYISSAGLRVLLSAQKKMQKVGSMKVKNVCDEVMDVFEITGFVDILTIE